MSWIYGRMESQKAETRDRISRKIKKTDNGDRDKMGV